MFISTGRLKIAQLTRLVQTLLILPAYTGLLQNKTGFLFLFSFLLPRLFLSNITKRARPPMFSFSVNSAELTGVTKSCRAYLTLFLSFFFSFSFFFFLLFFSFCCVVCKALFQRSCLCIKTKLLRLKVASPSPNAENSNTFESSDKTQKTDQKNDIGPTKYNV